MVSAGRSYFPDLVDKTRQWRVAESPITGASDELLSVAGMQSPINQIAEL